MKTITNPKYQLCFDEDLLTQDVAEQCFDAKYWQQQNKVLGSAKGRGTTWFIELESIEAALRHYHRGGLFGKVVRDHYLFFGWEKTRPSQEFEILQHLTKQGVNVPKPIAMQAVKRNFCYQADILTQRIENSEDLVKKLSADFLDINMYQKIGKQIRKLHDANVNHTDLNIHNILIDDKDQVWIIDFDKCHFEQEQNKPNHWQAKNLARLKRSFHKELKKRNIKWQVNTDWNALLKGYYQ